MNDIYTKTQTPNSKHLPQDPKPGNKIEPFLNKEKIVELLEVYYKSTISPTCSIEELAIRNGVKPKVIRNLIKDNKEALEIVDDLEEKGTYLLMQHSLKSNSKQQERLQELLLKRSTKVSFKFVGGKRTDIQKAITRKRKELEANVSKNKKELEKEWQE